MAYATMTASFLGSATPSGCSPITPVGRLSAKDAGAAEEQKVKINYDTKKEDKGFALLLGLHWPVFSYVGRLSAKDAGAAEEQKVKINYDTKKEDKGVALLLGWHWPVRRNRVPPTQKLGKPLLQFVLPCPQLRSVADEAL